MRKSIVWFMILSTTATFLHGMEPEIIYELGPPPFFHCDKTYINIQTTEGFRQIPRNNLPPSFNKHTITEIPTFEITDEMLAIIIEAATTLRLFPEKKDLLLEQFHEKVSPVFGSIASIDHTDYEEKIAQFQRALTYLSFPREYLKVTYKLNLAHPPKFTSEDLIPAIFTSDDGCKFPIYRRFLHPNIIIPKCYNYCSVTINVDASILQTVIPLITDYHCLTEYNADRREIILKCIEPLVTTLIELVSKSPNNVSHLRTTLNYFQLTELADFCKVLEGPFLTLQKFSLENAQRCMKELYLKNISLEELMLISSLLAHKYSLSQVMALNCALTQENMKAIDPKTSQSIPLSFGPTPELTPSIETQYKSYLDGQLNPSDTYKRGRAFDFLQISDINSLQTPQPRYFQEQVLDKQSWQDLELFCGQKNSPSHYVAAELQTYTEIGRTTLYKTISSCTTDIEKLTTRQWLIYALADKPHFEKLDKAFKELAEAEVGVFPFWDDEDMFKRSLRYYNFSLFGLDGKYKWAKKASTWLNSNTKAQEASNRFSQITNTLMTPLFVVTSIFSGGAAFLSHSTKIGGTSNELGCLESPGMLLSYPDSLEGRAWYIDCLRLRLFHLAKYFKAVEKIHSILETLVKSDSLKKMNKHTSFNELDVSGILAGFRDNCNFENTTKEIIRLRNKLKTKTFGGSGKHSKHPVFRDM